MVHGGSSRGMVFQYLPALSIVQLHPVVLAILNLSGALKSLSEQLTEVIVIGSIFEAEVADIAEILV